MGPRQSRPSTPPFTLQQQRIGGWLPRDHHGTEQWLENLIQHVDSKSENALKPELQDFQNLIEGDVTFRILASLMFEQIPNKEPYTKDPSLKPQVRDYKHMLLLVNHIMESAPHWSHAAINSGFIGFPVNGILNWPINTALGNAFFLRPDVNKQWMKILNKWAEYLATPSSADVLTTNEDGWLSPPPLQAMATRANNGITNHTFSDLYVCDPQAKHYGFTSWDAFFTREFRPNIRPLPPPNLDLISLFPTISNPGSLILNPCESSPYSLRRNASISAHAPFWLKHQPYSLADMLAHDPLVSEFVGGTVYQAYLDALSYHRWHAPVSGRVLRVLHVPGTYYSANYFTGFGGDGPDSVAPNNSQRYITQVATRTIIFIKADAEDVGVMAFIAVGMCEVGSCEVTVEEGQRVEAGEEIGMFHYGGSTCCLLFRREVEVGLVREVEREVEKAFRDGEEGEGRNLPVRGVLAVVDRKGKGGNEGEEEWVDVNREEGVE